MPDKYNQAVRTLDADAPAVSLGALWWLTVAGCALLVLGAKLWLIADFGSATPVWDQWDGEAAALYHPYLSDHIPLATFFSPHNEHRILLTRLTALGLLEISGQWDVMLQMILNAALHTGFIVVLLYLLRDLFDRRSGMLLAMFAALLMVVPVGWENALNGFQNQFYFLLLFSLLALACMLSAAAGSRSWWIGIALSVFSFFCMSSGALTVATGAGMAGIQMVLGQRRGRREVIGIGVQVVLAGLMLSAVPMIEGTAPLRAHSVGQYFVALRQSVSWPMTSSDFAPFVVFAPMILFAIGVVREPRTAHPTVWLCLGLGAWVLAQHVSLAYGRATGVNASRYLDLKTLGLIVNFAALLAVLCKVETRTRRQAIALVVLPGLWLALVGIDFGKSAFRQIPSEIAEKGANGRTQTENLGLFLKTGDASVLHGKPLFAIPYPDPDRLAMLASLPTIRGILPPELVDDPAAREAMRQRLWTRGRLHFVAAGIDRAGLVSGPYMVFSGVVLLFVVGLFASPGLRRIVKADAQ